MVLGDRLAARKWRPKLTIRRSGSPSAGATSAGTAPPPQIESVAPNHLVGRCARPYKRLTGG